MCSSDLQSLGPLLRGETMPARPILAQAVQIDAATRALRLENVLVDLPYWYNNVRDELKIRQDGHWVPTEDRTQATAMDLKILGILQGSRWGGARPSLPEDVRKALQARGYW